MSPAKDQIDTKEFLNIGEAARMFKVATSLIRYWESEFDILNPGKDEKGNRRYSSQDIENLRTVHHLVKERGFTLQGAKNMLKEDSDGINKEIELLKSLQKVRSLLVELREQI